MNEQLDKQEIEFGVLRIYAESLYDHQGVRMASVNRIRCLMRRVVLGLGYKPEKKKKKTDSKKPENDWSDKQLFAMLEDAESRKLLSKADHDFIKSAYDIAKRETVIEMEYEKKLKPLIEKEPIWYEWLQYVKGIGVRNAARLLKYYGYCERFDTISKLWKYSGLSPGENGGPAIKRKKGEKLPYNLKIKTGIVGVVSTSFMKANNKYKQLVMEPYKSRILTRPQGCCNKTVVPDDGSKPYKCNTKPGHAHQMAVRKMMCIFLQHYWLTCRKIKGLPVSDPYPHAKLGHTTIIKPLYDKEKI